MILYKNRAVSRPTDHCQRSLPKGTMLLNLWMEHDFHWTKHPFRWVPRVTNTKHVPCPIKLMHLMVTNNHTKRYTHLPTQATIYSLTHSTLNDYSLTHSWLTHPLNQTHLRDSVVDGRDVRGEKIVNRNLGIRKKCPGAEGGRNAFLTTYWPPVVWGMCSAIIFGVVIVRVTKAAKYGSSHVSGCAENTVSENRTREI